MRSIGILLFVIAALLAWNVAHPTPAASGITQWEYSVADIPDEQLVQRMGEAGRAGWELAFARRALSSDPAQKASYELIFKRPRQENYLIHH